MVSIVPGPLWVTPQQHYTPAKSPHLTSCKIRPGASIPQDSTGSDTLTSHLTPSILSPLSQNISKLPPELAGARLNGPKELGLKELGPKGPQANMHNSPIPETQPIASKPSNGPPSNSLPSTPNTQGLRAAQNLCPSSAPGPKHSENLPTSPRSKPKGCGCVKNTTVRSAPAFASPQLPPPYLHPRPMLVQLPVPLVHPPPTPEEFGKRRYMQQKPRQAEQCFAPPPPPPPPPQMPAAYAPQFTNQQHVQPNTLQQDNYIRGPPMIAPGSVHPGSVPPGSVPPSAVPPSAVPPNVPLGAMAPSPMGPSPVGPAPMAPGTAGQPQYGAYPFYCHIGTQTPYPYSPHACAPGQTIKHEASPQLTPQCSATSSASSSHRVSTQSPNPCLSCSPVQRPDAVTHFDKSAITPVARGEPASHFPTPPEVGNSQRVNNEGSQEMEYGSSSNSPESTTPTSFNQKQSSRKGSGTRNGGTGRIGKQPVRDPAKLKHRIWLQQNRVYQDKLHAAGFRVLEGVNGSKVCSLCNKHFPKEMFVWRHALTHVDEKPFHCTVCNQKFTRSDTLQRHIRRAGHHPPVTENANDAESE